MRCIPAFLQRWICFHRDASKQYCNFVLYNFNQDSPAAYSRELLPTASHCALPKGSHYYMHHSHHVIHCKRECSYRARHSTCCINTCHTASSPLRTIYKTLIPQNSRETPCLRLNMCLHNNWNDMNTRVPWGLSPHLIDLTKARV